MVDVLIENDVQVEFFRKIGTRHIVWTGPLTCYVFYVENSDDDLEYRKTTDGGLTWTAGATPVKIRTGALKRFDIYYDRWTKDDTGRIIHIASLDSASDDVQYNSLDTSDDSLGAGVVIANSSTATGDNRNITGIAITKARGNGFLYVQYWSQSTDHDFYQSDDGGLIWNLKADGADGNAVDEVQLLYGNEADTDDIWMIYWDRSASEITLKVYDFSLDSWSETLISAGMIAHVQHLGNNAAMRHSDNHAILMAFNNYDAATADQKVWDIASAASITAKTDVITNSAETYYPCIMINQQDDTLYAGYLRGGVLNSSVDAYFKKSTDGGDTWEVEEPYSEDAADDNRFLAGGISVGSDGGKFQPVWFNDDLDDLFTNVNNGVSIPAVVSPSTPASLPEYGQLRTAIGNPSVYGATILRS